MSEFLTRYGMFLVILAFCVVALIFRQKRVDTLLDSWAAANGVEIIDRTLGLFRRGPFFFTLGHQVVYHLVVRDRIGVERGCWVRLGSFFMGLLSDKVEARWEKGDPFAGPVGSSRFDAS